MERSDSLRDVRARNVHMPDQMWEALRRESDRTGIAMSELVRHAVTMYMAALAVVRAVDAGADPQSVVEMMRAAVELSPPEE